MLSAYTNRGVNLRLRKARCKSYQANKVIELDPNGAVSNTTRGSVYSLKTRSHKPRTVQDIISEIEQKSKGGGYIYRGERKLHKEPPYNGKVSSNLWREYCIEEEYFDIEIVQRKMLNDARKHVGD